MTEAMSRHEIEDVLSSIRRLVSHEDRDSAEQTNAVKAVPAKLVLTSALRVDDTTLEADGKSEDPLVEEAQVEMQTSVPEIVQSVPPSTPREPDVSPRFADAPARAPLLTRIAQAGQLSASSEPKTFKTPEPVSSEQPLAESMSDNVLEATLARLEAALSIAPQDADTASDTVVEEDALAQIVAKIVRKELQGELGERITRNIRKLVRAEVARELQMRNL